MDSAECGVDENNGKSVVGEDTAPWDQFIKSGEQVGLIVRYTGMEMGLRRGRACWGKNAPPAFGNRAPNTPSAGRPTF